MSTQPWFPMLTGAAQRPNGSIPNPAVVSASVLGKTVRRDAGSEKAPADDAILSVAAAADRQSAERGAQSAERGAQSAERLALGAPRSALRAGRRLRRLFRAAVGV